jgi:hypothetical protein
MTFNLKINTRQNPLTSNLSNEIICRPSQSRETIPLTLPIVVKIVVEKKTD